MAHPLENAEAEAIEAMIDPAVGGMRLDRALAAAFEGMPGMSRSRIAGLIAEGAVSGPSGATVTESSRKVKVGERYRLVLPPPVEASPLPEAIPLSILYEDAHLLVVDKPAGMVVHPAPGAQSGTLVNALLAHCGDTLPGIGGERRPGIVHRIDKDTSGLLVVARTEAAHAGLSARFAAHDIEREYLAVMRGVPDPARRRLQGWPGLAAEPGGVLRVEAAIGRHPRDRKRMAVREEGGRRAVTRFRVLERFGAADRPCASLVSCRLETGRTHQIRVHAAHVGHALIGDTVYGTGGIPGLSAAGPEGGEALKAFLRQALHAARLGFAHPVTHAPLVFESAPPADMAALLALLRRNTAAIR